MDRREYRDFESVSKSESRLHVVDDNANIPVPSSSTAPRLARLPGDPITTYEERYESSVEVDRWVETQSIETRKLDRHDRMIMKIKVDEIAVVEEGHIIAGTDFNVLVLVVAPGSHIDRRSDAFTTLPQGRNDIEDEIERFHGLVMSLADRSAHISPLWQRGERIRSPINVTAWCNYKNKDVEIRVGDDVTLLDNSDLINWTVRVDGITTSVPSVVFRIPPPDSQLTAQLTRLAAQLEVFLSDVKKKYMVDWWSRTMYLPPWLTAICYFMMFNMDSEYELLMLILQNFKFINESEANAYFCSELLWPSDFKDPNTLRHPFSGARSQKLQQDLNDDFIAIEEYGDEFETCNPLGAKKGKHKVMGKYCRILNLGDHVSSTLMQIFLYLIGTSDDFKKYRNTTLLWTLEELKELETSGIWAYDKHGRFRRIPVVLFSSVGDNLYSNDVNGLQMSFSNGRPCRACPLKYAELVKLVSLNGIRLRSRESYDAAVNDPSSLPKDTGIHRRCAFNELQFYHCMEAIVFDPMHDLGHGHGSWFLKGVLKSIIVDNNIISLEELNALIEEFPFHGRHQSTKPGPLPLNLFVQRRTEHCTGNKRRRRIVSEEQEDDTDAEDEAIIGNGKTITQSASQMVTLLTFLPLILRSFADELQHVPEWTEFLHFQRMLDIIFSHSLEKAHVTELRILTEQHLAFCVRRWKQVLPKAHFLLHYPDAMLQMGPLRHYWCFSYESKHQTFKRYADTIFCYKNIPKSLAYKNQLSLIPFLKVIQQGNYCETYSEFVIHQKLYLPNKKVVFSQNNTIFVGTIQSIGTCNNETHLNLCHVNPVSFDSTLHCYVYDPDDSNVSVVIPHHALVIPLPIHLYCNRYFRVVSAHA
uniref:SH3_10 domain-containing protein n=1 Tax=Panagrellus redivivus TaxID=6233 RepID=A0A7E4VBR1_PANRE